MAANSFKMLEQTAL